MNTDGVGLRAGKKEQFQYKVVVVYHPDDSHNDKNPFRNDDGKAKPLAFECLVWSDSADTAITSGLKIIQTSRAEEMTDFILNHPIFGDNQVFTRDEIEQIQEEAINVKLFRTWLLLEPTMIQVNRVDDEDLLKNVMIEQSLNQINNIGDSAEEYLKELNNDA
jgi:hypothetical protein